LTTRSLIGASDRVTPASGVHARAFDEEWILLDLTGGNYYGLDELGGRIWSGLLAGQCAHEMADELALAYQVDRSVLVEDIVTFLNSLSEKGLVRRT
jgi:Coenzyme PQQ synthesis protein D (PqqD)